MKLAQKEEQQQLKQIQHHNKFPREELKENPKNLDIGGAYQKLLYNCGEICGNCRAVCPCLFCVEYPYVTITQGSVGVYLRFGKYIKTVNAGLAYYNPCTDRMIRVDCKMQMIDCQKQSVMTKDNIVIIVDATVYYRIVDAKKTIFYVNNIRDSVAQLTLATIKSVVGGHTLQDILEQRQALAASIQEFVDEHVLEWGVDIENVILTDIQLNQSMKEIMSSAAVEQRNAMAKIMQAQANVLSAKLMREAAEQLASKAAMQIRYLETVGVLGTQQSTKVIVM